MYAMYRLAPGASASIESSYVNNDQRAYLY